jgi:hypothetical protein
MPQYVLWAESEIVYFYAMKKFRTVGGKCGTGHSRRPLAVIEERRTVKKVSNEFKKPYLCKVKTIDYEKYSNSS